MLTYETTINSPVMPKTTKATSLKRAFTQDELLQLLAINKAITETRNAVDLLAAIRQTVMELIPFYDTGILIVEKDGMHHYDMAVNIKGWDVSIGNTKLYETGLQKMVHKGSYIEYVEKLIEEGQSPVIEDYTLRLKEFNYPFFTVLKEVGYKEGLVTVLKANGKTFGTFWLNSLEKDHFKKEQFSLFQAVAEQVSIAVANILVNEEIMGREREKTLLLSISEAISKARNTTELLATIREKVMQLIPFYDTGILIVEKDGMHHYDMSVNFPGWDDSEVNKRLQQQKHLLKIKHPNSYVAHIQQQLEIQSPIIENWELAMDQWDHPFFSFTRETGYKEGLVMVLKSGGTVYGSFWLNSIEKNQFKEDQFPLFQAISEQVSVAVANILANEEIREREKEKTILLSISEAVATIRDKKELLKFVFEKVKPLFGFYDAGFFVFSYNKQFIEDWTVAMPETSPSAANYKLAANHASSFLFPASGLEIFYKQLKESKGPAIAYYNEELFARFPDYPQWDVIREMGYKESIGTLLRSEDGDLGILFFNSLTENHFSVAQFSLFQGIADQLATAVANILANEEILEREKEKDILLNISQQLSSVKTADELLQIIIREVKPVFSFYDTGIILIDEEANGYYDLSVIHPHIDDSEVNYYLHDKGYYSNQVIGLANSGIEWIIQQFKKETPLVFKYNMDHSAFSDHELLTEIEKAGYSEAWVCPLEQQGKIFGVLTLNYTYDHQIQLEKKHLFLALTDRISSSLSNILANQEILKREKEKSQLLEISEAIATVQSSKQLLKVIYEKIQPAFEYDSAGLFILDKEGNNCYEITDFEVLPDAIQQEIQGRNLLGPFPMTGFSPDFWFYYNEPVITNVQLQAGYVIDNNSAKEQFEIGLAHGLTDMICGPLNCAGRKIGMLCFSTKREYFYRASHINLFKSMSDLIAIAVANILANEEILEREKEKTLLLDISNSIAQINNKVDLLKSIDELLWPIFHHDDAGFSIVDKDKKFFTDYHNLYSGEIPATEEAKYLNSLIYKEVYNVEDSTIPFPGSIVEHYMYRKPEIGKLQNTLELGANTDLLTLEIKYGLVYYICAPLAVGGKNLGLFNLLFKEENKPSASFLGLFAQIAEIMALAFSNILANEEIIEREREKTILLELTELIAQVKNKNDLLKLIVDKIKPIFNFHDCGLFILSKNGLHHSDLAAVLPDVSISNWNEKIAALSTDIPHKDSPIEWMISSIENARQPVLFDFVDLVDKFPRYPQIDGTGLLQMCYRDCLATNLKVGGKTIGMFCINALAKDFFPITKFNILQSVGDTLAIAVANILANEEILEREKEKTQLLKISEAIASIQNYKELLKVIYELIQPVFPFDNTGLFIFDPLNEQLNEITHGDVLSGAIAESFAEAKVLGPFALKDFKKSSWYFSAVPVITTLSKEVKLINDVICKQQMNISIKAGLKQMICGPLVTGGKKIGAIYLSTKDAGLYNETHIHLFKSVTNLIAIAVANILANREIIEREREKSLLVEINDAVVLIKEKASLFHLMMQKLQPFAGFDDAVLVMLSKDGNYCNGMIEAVEIVGPGYAKFNGLIPLSTPIKNSPADFLRKQPDLYMWDLDEMETLYPNHPYLGMMRQKGLRYSVYLKVNWDVNNQVGFLNFHFKEKEGIQTKYFNLYRNVAYQLAASLSNIIAQEEIENKAKEIVSLNRQLEAQNTYLVEEVEQQYNFEEMIGQNAQFAEVCRNIALVAKTDSSVLILGETGTGKELVARAIHNNSNRKNKPLIKLNCAALPANLIESELFGHERGAFTGAIERRIGKFELANGSTLFLDEVGELPLELQSKLLRALQEKEIERLGSNKTLQVDVRIIAATNRELEKEVQAGKFRQDLYYRLHIFPITLPALRERKEDIPLLAAHFIERYAKKIGKKIQGLNNKAVQEMMSYNWPGNIRELEHVIERSVILAKSQLIQDLNLPVNSKKRITTSPTEFVVKSWEQQERDYILEVLKVTKGNMAGKGGAAELLQLPPTTLQSKMKKLGIKRKHFVE